MNKQITIDLRAVSHATLHYENGKGDSSRLLPHSPTVNGSVIQEDAMAYGLPSESLLDRAKRLNLLDTWFPICILQLRNNHCLTFTHNKAKKYWKAYNTHIYKKK